MENNNKSFVKLFNLNVPVIEHLDYYLEQMSKTIKFKDIKYLKSLYDSETIGIDNVLDFKSNKSKEIIDFLKGTNAYNEMLYDKSLIDYPTAKSIEYQEGINYLSIDIKSANFSALKRYDVPLNELGENYFDFISKFNVPNVFIHSKYLRQFIFGNLNPKKIVKVQRNMIQEIVRKYQDHLQVEGVKSDEVIFSFKNFSEISSIFNEIDKSKYNVKIFSINRVEDFRIDNIYDIDGNLYHREMMGVDGNLFYLKLKEYITKEPLDVKDLYFKINGRLAIIATENIKIEL